MEVNNFQKILEGLLVSDRSGVRVIKQKYKQTLKPYSELTNPTLITSVEIGGNPPTPNNPS